MKPPGATVDRDGESARISSDHDSPPMIREAGITAGIEKLPSAVPSLKAMSLNSTEVPATASPGGIERTVVIDCA
jgi:hypothetical protein